MTSDIDELLGFLRENEAHLRSSLATVLADSHTKWIAAVEELRDELRELGQELALARMK